MGMNTRRAFDILPSLEVSWLYVRSGKERFYPTTEQVRLLAQFSLAACPLRVQSMKVRRLSVREWDCPRV